MYFEFVVWWWWFFVVSCLVGGGGRWFLVITVYHLTFCLVGVGVVVEVELDCDNFIATNRYYIILSKKSTK